MTVIVVDEVAFLTAYLPDKRLRDRIKAALATLTTQGRAVGFAVVAALQDPRKEVMSIRNLFPDRIAMRLDEAEQVDMVLGDGARDRGATADLISTNPATGAGVALVRLADDPDPIRVRAGWVTDTDGAWLNPDDGTVAFGDYAQAWIAERAGLRPTTAAVYRYLLHRHLTPVFDNRAVADIREPHVRRWRKDLLDARC